MKKIFLILGSLIILGTQGLVLMTPMGCGSTPASPAAVPTPTPTVDIVWAYPSVYHYLGGQNAFIYLRVNGQAVTNAGVTLSGTFTGSPVALPHSGFVTYGAAVFGKYSSTAFNFEANKVYTLSTTSMGKTASSSVTSPGGITLLSDANGAVTQASWTYEGTNDEVDVYENSPTAQSTFITSGDATSPVAIPDSGGSNAYPDGSGSTYAFEAAVKNVNTIVANGAMTLSANFYVQDYQVVDVTLP